MNRKIKPIPTIYNGVKYRSRTEARWALFMEKLGLTFDYEPDGFELPSGRRYLPDFYIHDFKTYLEVKPNSMDIVKEEYSKFEEFAKAHQDIEFWIALGSPSCERGNILVFEKGDEINGVGFFENGWERYLAEDRRDPGVYWLAYTDKPNGYVPLGGALVGGPGEITDHDREPIVYGLIREAYDLVKSHKF